jgi:phenylacetate-CoA ligase
MSANFNDLANKLLNKYYKAVIYTKYSKFAIESEYWDEAKWRVWQWDKIKSLLNYSYKWVPYYRELFNRLKITDADIKSWGDFANLPLLTKETVRYREKDLLTTHPIERRLAFHYSTGGSTGKPLVFYSSREQQYVTSAFMNFQWKRIGYKPSDTRVIIRGLFSKNLIERTTPNIWNITTSQISKENINVVRDFLNQVKPSYIHAYPSSLWTITNLFIEQSMTLDYKPKGLLIGSEMYSDSFRKLFEEFYKCKSYSWLGVSEGTILAGECENSTNYHILPGYSYVELIKQQSENPSADGLEIIGTSFHNRAFPFIRYSCGDTANITDSKCNCGRGYQIISNVIGRDSEFFIGKDGSKLSVTTLRAIHADVLGKMIDFQFVQNKPGEAIVNIIKDPTFCEEDGVDFISELNKRGGGRMTYVANYTDKLIKTKSGKARILINNIGQDDIFQEDI